jgi:ATP-dependent Clp protease ATP-binding subunit ClpA
MPETMLWSSDAEKVLRQAHIVAQQLGSQQAEPEHMLIALMEHEGSIPAGVLHDDIHLNLQDVYALLNLIDADFRGGHLADGGMPRSSPRLLEVWFAAGNEAVRAGRSQIEIIDLLLGVLASKDRVIMEVFKRLTVNPQAVRAALHQRMPEIPLEYKRRKRVWRSWLRYQVYSYLRDFFPFVNDSFLRRLLKLP